MKSFSLILAAIGCLAVATPAMVTPAAAETVSRTVSSHYGYYGHGCRTIRTVVTRAFVKRVIVRKVCR